MQINKLFISGFKCFKKSEFDLNNITVLTGSNGTGKSSLIQAILLTRLGIEKNYQDNQNQNYVNQLWKGLPVPLNKGYELKLGTVFNIFNDNDFKDDKITIGLDDEIFEIYLSEVQSENTSVNFRVKQQVEVGLVPFWRKKEFYYLNTERLGPKHLLESNFTEFDHCGYRGEFTAQVMLKNSYTKITDERASTKIKSNYLPQQVDAWINEICPGTSVSAKPLSPMTAQIFLRNNASKNELLAPQIGFGISYALPIIVTGLIAVKGSAFIIENPEAHLHPKGQSNMGYFLGKVAATGVKVIIETHSEHIVNGIRRAILSSKLISTNNISIFFFNGFVDGIENIQRLKVNSKGDLSDFPVDFFDQARQDMIEILKLSKR